MADPDVAAPPSTAALPPTTVRQLGSSNVLRDPSSVVKELIDNALDARTNAIFVDVSANTLDFIQVKDTGHGISAEDRPLACRRYCTSKIRDFHDLDEIGGTWLGFRGKALASMAEMSGGLEVTTRVEGEPVAVKLQYGRDGELKSTEHASAPVGTAVKVTNFLQTLPVRKESALKGSSKTLAKVKRLMQSYAFARPAVRFSLRVLKAKSNKGDFMYAPKRDANVEDAVLKIIGKQCALQCDWTAMESDGFEIRAFLPKPDAVGNKIANEGAFLSIDGRPVSTSRGIPKKLLAVFKERLREANPGLSSVKDPFVCMNIICPSGNYDPNIEPAKDDVLFEREDIVLSAVTKLFVAYYPEGAVVSDVGDEPEPPVSTQRPIRDDDTGAAIERPESACSILKEATTEEPRRPETGLSILEEVPPVEEARSIVAAPPRWRLNMYGIDEEDLALLDPENQPPTIEEDEDGRQAANVSNPWTIARMKASVKLKQSTTNNAQLMTPARSHRDATMNSSSPATHSNTRQRLPLEPLTPETVSRTNMLPEPRGSVLQHSFEQFSQVSERLPPATDQEDVEPVNVPATRSTRTLAALPLDIISPTLPGTRRSGKNQQPRGDQQPLHAFEGRPDDNGWFGKPMQGQAPPKPSHAQKPKRPQNMDVPMWDSDVQVQPLTSKNNTDIRDFLGRGRAQPHRSTSLEPTPGPSSFTPINRPFGQPRVLDDERYSEQEILRSAAPKSIFRASSAEPPRRTRRAQNPQFNSDGFEPAGFAEQLRAYAERDDLTNSRARASSIDSAAVVAPSNATDSSRLPTARSRTTDQEMNTMFAAYSDPPNDSPNTSRTAIPQHNKPAHETTTKSQPKRRRTTDGAQRTKSSRLPLERVLQGHRIHNVVLPLDLLVTDITKAMRKLDMRRNSPEWEYPVDSSTYDGFSMKVTHSVLRAWVLRLDGMLEHFDTQLDRVAAMVTLERSIAKALREREENNEGTTMMEGGEVQESVEPGIEDCMNGLEQAREWAQKAVLSHGAEEPTPEVLNLPQTINSTLLVAEEGAADEFGGEEFDDEEMLMDF